MKRYTIYYDKDKEGILYQGTDKEEFIECLVDDIDRDKYPDTNSKMSIEKLLKRSAVSDEGGGIDPALVFIENIEDLDFVLVSYEANWADEMDIEGHYVCTADEWAVTQKLFRSIKTEISYCIGTNEEIEYSNGTSALANFSSRPLTTKQAEVLYELGLDTAGFTGPCAEEELEILDDD